MASLALVAISLSATAVPAEAATIQVTHVFAPGEGSFRIPENATNISVTLSAGEGFGFQGDGGGGGSMDFTLGRSFAGTPVLYTVGAAGDVETVSGTGDDVIGYRGGGGASVFAVPGILLVVVGGGGGSGGSIAGDRFAGGDGGVVSGRSDGGGGAGRGSAGNAGQGGQAPPSGPLRGFAAGGQGGTGRPGGQSGQDVQLRVPPGTDFVLAAGGAAGVATQFSACGGGGSGYAGGGGGGTLGGADGCGAGGGGSGALQTTNRDFSETSSGVNSGDGSLTIRFSVPELVVTLPTLPVAQQGVSLVTPAVTVTGGATRAGRTSYEFAVADGALPDGLDIDPFTGRIGGAPTVNGVFPFTLEVTDANSPAPQTVSIPLSLTVRPAPVALVPAADATGRVGQPLTWSPATLSGGTAPFSWSVESGSIPPGTSFDSATGVVSGIPTTASTYSVSLGVQDSSIPPGTAVAGPATLVLSTTPIGAPATVRRGASAAVSASGLVVGDYEIDLDGTQVATTTVTASGDLGSTVAVPLSETLGSHVVSVLYQGVEVGRTTVQVFSAALTATALTLPDGEEGEPYSAEPVSVSGGLAPLSYSSPDLPAGLSIEAATGRISGVPSAAGSFTIHIEVVDAELPAQTASVTTALEVALAPPPALELAASPVEAHVDVPFAAIPVAVSGGTAPYTYALGAGETLPPGMTLDAATGVISGTAGAPFTGTFSIVVTDSSAQPQTASASFSLAISQLTIDVTSPVPIGGTLTVSGEHFDPGDYDVVLHSDPIALGSASVGPDGSLRFSATVPSSVTPGDHQVEVLRSGLTVATAPVTVTAVVVPPPTPPAGGAGASTPPMTESLAATGIDQTPGWVIGFALLLAGAFAVRPSRPRPPRRPHQR
ncbi:putative Ig domain-containing protein [Leifsonia sp. 2TAF2]|uniref:putative Ig domain-containing protein n=1 Tax=Leifsonia sp. 2TAF2 TaxID=3233009 RepID=UPI003F9BE677